MVLKWKNMYLKNKINKEHLTNFELVVKTKRSAHSLPFEVDAQI